MRSWLLIILVGVSVIGCSPVIVFQNPARTITPTVLLTPFITEVVTSTSTISPVSPTPTQLPLPTATPFTHTVKKDETMLGIAFTYGVKLEELMAANPGINPRLLSIGTVLVIPLAGQQVAPQSTEKPAQLAVSDVSCYLLKDGNQACFSEIHNREDLAVDNLVLQFEVYDHNGNLVTIQNATPPIDRLGSGVNLPVFAILPGFSNDEVSVNLRVLTALIVPEDSQRYINVSLGDVHIQRSVDGLSARVTGKAGYERDLSSLWLVGIAFDHKNKPIGIRRIVLQNPCLAVSTPEVSIQNPQAPSECPVGMLFDFIVFSAGAKIERVEIFSEGHR